MLWKGSERGGVAIKRQEKDFHAGAGDLKSRRASECGNLPSGSVRREVKDAESKTRKTKEDKREN